MATVDPIDWLLEEDQPGVRLRTLTELLGRSESDPGVRAARRSLLRRGWAADLFAERRPGNGWGDGPSLYRPKYTSTHWKMLALSELGLTRAEPTVRSACEYWAKGFATRDGGLGGNSVGTPHYCLAGNMARAMIRFGYADDPRVRRTLVWLTETADPKGGWSCFGTGRNLDSWEALSAFAVYPRDRWTPAMRGCVERGAEFFLERELHRQGARYAPWYRLHWPVHYYYDLLVGLDFLTRLGYADDPRLGFARDHLLRRRRPDGRWNLDGLHPDVEGAIARWFRDHPKDRPTPWGLERPGRPSKMVTLTALGVLQRTGDWRPGERGARGSARASRAG
jgi:hypothetical protein